MSSSLEEPPHLSKSETKSPRHIEPFIHDYTRIHFISTLDPSRLIRADYLRISNALYLPLCPRMLWPYEPSSEQDSETPFGNSHQSPYTHPYVSFVGYTTDKKGKEVPYPKDTGGFYYYHQPTSAPPASGQLRFRITSNSNPETWASGVDLYQPNGLVWRKPLMEIIGKHPTLTALRTLLLTDGLISPELVQRCAEIHKLRRSVGPNVILYELGQVFWTAFSAFDKGQFVAVGREDQKYVKVGSFFRDLRSKPINPWAGSGLCAFELYDPSPSRVTRRNMRKATQSDRAPTRKIVLRILKILDPVTCRIKNYDGFVNEPQAGSLMMLGVGDSRRPWMYNVDTGQEAPCPKASKWVDPEDNRQQLEGLRLLLDYHETS